MGGELGTHEAAQPGVIGGIGHPETAGILVGREATTAHHVAVVVAERVRVGEHCTHVVDSRSRASRAARGAAPDG